MSKRVALILTALVALVGVGLVVAGASVLLDTTQASKRVDSGVVACREFAKNATEGKTNSSNKPMTQAEYDKVRGPFVNSGHGDIKTAGTNLVDTIYKVSSKGTDDMDLGGAIMMMTTLQTQYSTLQTACENHGVTLPPLPTS